MSVQYARVEHKSASLSSEFGQSFARRIFGDAVIDALPKITRGKRKGETSGQIEWEKCTTGGWSNARGGVVRPGVLNVKMRSGSALYLDPRSWMTEDCHAKWVARGRPAWRHDEPICDIEDRWGVLADRREKVRNEIGIGGEAA